MRTYHHEKSFMPFYNEGIDLFNENNKELNFFNKNLEINIPLYLRLEELNLLKVFSVREDSKLVGYCTFTLQPHMQHKHDIQARQDVLFIKPEYRGHGVRFITYCEDELRKMGVSFIFRSVTRFKDWSLILKRLNYEEMETIYMKDLREV
jgi:GNAT superfamily N-acetyltransferase